MTAAATAYALRSYTRRLAVSTRVAGCGVRAVSLYPSIEVRRNSQGAQAKFQGVLKCGHIWTCPVCSRQLRAERATRIRRAIENAGGRWQMVTMTIRHHRDSVALAPMLAGLTRAWRRTRQGGAVQRLWSEHVTASVRATEMTHGQNGWHPHIHAVLRTTEWDEADRETLVSRFQDSVTAELGAAYVPNDAHAMFWSREHDGGIATYLTKLGLEITGYEKESKWSASVWDLARDASRRLTSHLAPDGFTVPSDISARPVVLWQEYQRATKGKRMIELDDRAQRWAGEQGPTLNAYDGEEVLCGECPEPTVVTKVDLWREEVAALRGAERALPGAPYHLLRSIEASADAPANTVRDWFVEHARGSLQFANRPAKTA